MKHMEELRDMLCRELETFSSGSNLTSGALESIDKLTHSIKSIDTIIAMENSKHSNDGYSYKRDSMGRYSRDDYSRDDYSREDGYSRGYSRDDHIRGQLEDMMNSTSDPRVKRSLREAISAMGR